ncbi:MAG TPA: GlsB/YeaQ/YmgE family stress response membrane protein [Gallionellaceae bacterium]|nr:GlsB/YeaQ/YmgE family stress response membrane protein [Gallionellaceae bacterium]
MVSRSRGVDMSWIISLIIGGVVGWVASLFMKTDAQMGLIANVVLGVLGSMLGYWIAGLLGIAPTGILRFVVALAGAVLLIYILRKLGFFGNA